jgi:hypothetical protein
VHVAATLEELLGVVAVEDVVEVGVEIIADVDAEVDVDVTKVVEGGVEDEATVAGRH